MSNEALFVLFRTLTIFFATAMLIKYFIFLLLAGSYDTKEKIRRIKLLRKVETNPELKNYEPLVTVVVPAWNESVGIIKTVSSILASKYRHVEIIVVNDGSTDNSYRRLEAYLNLHEQAIKRTGKTVRHFYKENGGKGSALNYGITRASGDIVVTIDADSRIDKRALPRLVDYFRDPEVDAVVGNVKIANNKTLVGMLQQLEYLFGFYFKRAHCVMGAEYIYGGACAAFRVNKTFEFFGRFDESNKTEDIELSMRTKYHGLKSLYAEDVICYTEGASTVSALIDQRLRWKKGRFDTFVRYRRMFFSTAKTHNRPLGWFVLPFSLLAEFQLLFEPIGVAFLVSYSVISGDYVSLTLGMMFLFITYFVVALFGKHTSRLKLLLLFPVTWPLFYILVWIEYHALLRSLVMGLRGEEITWQNWERQGI